jgi:hypothetical protein
MDHSLSEQSPSDRTPDGESLQSPIIYPTNDIQESFEELPIEQKDDIRKSNTKISRVMMRVRKVFIYVVHFSY